MRQHILGLSMLSLVTGACGGSAVDFASQEHWFPGGGAPGSYERGPRPVDILSAGRAAEIQALLPRVRDPWLDSVLRGSDTMWYDRTVIVPGYQDSFGDNVVAPVGMRPNTIRRSLIDTAVPGGHAQILTGSGDFHFPFGRAGGAEDPTNTYVVDFWQLPLDRQGVPRPVVWWRRDPNNLTHRYEWAFPTGTVLGEVIFIIDGNEQWFPFEIRTRVRQLEEWTVDVFRPFPRAIDLAESLEERLPEHSETSEILALIDHLEDEETLVARTLRATHFASAFPPMAGALDFLPPLPEAVTRDLLRETPFASARGTAWKDNGALRTWAATTDSDFHIVPRNYNGGFLEVDEETCSLCHQDAGRPFKDYYSNILAYGELWGEDESFSWHPFETERFVDGNGKVKNFNYDNRRMRPDFVEAGILESYDPQAHRREVYAKLPGSWKDYAY